jgi:phosphomannomutase/phosphoglucomutase
LLGELPQYAPSGKYRFHCPEEAKSDIIADLIRFFVSQGREIETLDGCKVYWTNRASEDTFGWGLVRPSNTEPAITLRCEARSPTQLKEIEQTMRNALDSTLCAHGLPAAANGQR